MESKTVTPLRAIRLKCLDCSCGSAHEVRQCTAEGCPLYPFRIGKNPNRKGIGGNGRFGAESTGSTCGASENE